MIRREHDLALLGGKALESGKGWMKQKKKKGGGGGARERKGKKEEGESNVRATKGGKADTVIHKA